MESRKNNKNILLARDSLEAVCKTYDKKGILFLPLKRLLYWNIPFLEKSLSERESPLVISSIMLYKGEYEKAKKYFKIAGERHPDVREDVEIILENFDTAYGIARKWWELEGMYEKEENRTKAGL